MEYDCSNKKERHTDAYSNVNELRKQAKWRLTQKHTYYMILFIFCIQKNWSVIKKLKTTKTIASVAEKGVEVGSVWRWSVPRTAVYFELQQLQQKLIGR